MAQSWTKRYLFGDDSPLHEAADGGELGESENELEAGVVTVGSGPTSDDVESVTGVSSEARESSSTRAAGESAGTEMSTIRLGMDAVGGRDCGVQTNLCLMDDETRRLLRLLLEDDEGSLVPAQSLDQNSRVAVQGSAGGNPSTAREPRSVPQDPRKFRSEAGRNRQRARTKARKAERRLRQRARLAEAEQRSPSSGSMVGSQGGSQ